MTFKLNKVDHAMNIIKGEMIKDLYRIIINSSTKSNTNYKNTLH